MLKEFCKSMPKVELHAHLNGSLSTETLMELGTLEYGETNEEFRKTCEQFQEKRTFSLNECFKKFPIAHALTATKEGLSRAMMSVIRDFAQDNVIYLELRTTPKSTAHMSQVEYLQCVLKTIREAKILFPDIIVKLLPSIDRSKGIKNARETIEIVTEALKDSSDIIKGIDLSGNPSSGSFEEFSDVLEKARSLNLKLALHCAEIDNEEETQKMLEFGMERCGHGTFMSPKNLIIVKDKKIPIECCLTSNVKCETVKSYAHHHFKNLYLSNHPVIICTDDAGVFDTTLSNEFAIAQSTFNLSKEDILKLSMTAVDASFASTPEKVIMRNKIVKFFADE